MGLPDLVQTCVCLHRPYGMRVCGRASHSQPGSAMPQLSSWQGAVTR